jgi:hypothetical protein
MTDRIFAPALVFIALIGAAFAVGSAWFDSRSTVQVVQLPSVQVHLLRLPSVEVVAQRAAPRQIAMTEQSAGSRVQ